MPLGPTGLTNGVDRAVYRVGPQGTWTTTSETDLRIRLGERVIIGPYSAVSRVLRSDMDVKERSSKGRRRGGPPDS